MSLVTLKKRSEYLRLRGGSRFATPSFVVETRPRIAPAEGGGRVLADGSRCRIDAPRFGFTVTKKLGCAVIRNRIRRRLKSAVRLLAPTLALPDHDYVLVARLAAFDRPFADIKKDLERALQRVHHPAAVAKK